jgi:hypothetical protein
MRIGPGPPVLELGSPSRIPEVSDALPIHELMPLRHFSERSLTEKTPVERAEEDLREGKRPKLRDWSRGQGAPAPYAREFQAWVLEKLKKKDMDALVDYRSASPHGVRARARSLVGT